MAIILRVRAKVLISGRGKVEDFNRKLKLETWRLQFENLKR
jgi:hypothetical protein